MALGLLLLCSLLTLLLRRAGPGAAAERAREIAKEQKDKIEAAIAATRAALAKAEQVRDVAP